MAKAVVWIGMLVVCFGGLFWGMQVLNADSGKLVGYAVSEKDDADEHQVQVLIGMMDTAMDPPLKFVSPTSATPDWNHWLEQHYFLTDADGNRVDLKKGGFQSKDIKEHQAGSAEFIALGQIENGKTYTLEVIPVVGEPEKYIHTIEGAAKEFRRTNFDPNY
jgi:hypothetical protein